VIPGVKHERIFTTLNAEHSYRNDFEPLYDHTFAGHDVDEGGQVPIKQNSGGRDKFDETTPICFEDKMLWHESELDH
jgi:hypothetical protein